jgi:hypothetical protein
MAVARGESGPARRSKARPVSTSEVRGLGFNGWHPSVVGHPDDFAVGSSG